MLAAKSVIHEERRRVFTVRERMEGMRAWFVIDDMPPLRNSVRLMRQLVHDWWALEWECWRGQKLGWLAQTATHNRRMLRIYPALGARRYGQNTTHVFFKKAITKPPPATCPTLEDMVRRIRGG